MKAELISTALYAEGRPRDVGTDRALANNYNVFIDTRSQHQCPYLRDQQTMGIFSGWRLLYFGPIFLGFANNSATVVRRLRLAPWLASADGSSVSARITISNAPPTRAPGLDGTNGTNVRFTGSYQQATFTTSSTTMAVQVEQQLDIHTVLTDGFVWIAYEVSSSKATTWGIATCVETARVVL